MKLFAPLLAVASIASLCQSASAQANYQVTVTGTVTMNTGNFADGRYNPAVPGTPFSMSYELGRNPIGGGQGTVYGLGQGPVTFTLGGTTITSPTPADTGLNEFEIGFGVMNLPNLRSTVRLQNEVDTDLRITGNPGSLFTSTNLNFNGSFSGSSAAGSFFNQGFSIFESVTLAEITADVLSIDVVVPNTIGTAYCSAVPNTTGEPGRLIITGSDVAADNDVTLNLDRLPAGSFGLGLVSQTSANTMLPGSSNIGILCLGGSIGRYNPPFQTNSLGQASMQVNLTQTPPFFVPIVSGQTWFFQGWHRDSSASGLPVSNLTFPVRVSFQ